GWYGGNAQDSVLDVDRPASSREHPTAKPVELITRCLHNSSRPGDVILDPFAGSGSTIIAAHMLGRRAFAMELDPAYAGVGIDRWVAFTGKRAHRVNAKSLPPSLASRAWRDQEPAERTLEAIRPTVPLVV